MRRVALVKLFVRIAGLTVLAEPDVESGNTSWFLHIPHHTSCANSQFHHDFRKIKSNYFTSTITCVTQFGPKMQLLYSSKPIQPTLRILRNGRAILTWLLRRGASGRWVLYESANAICKCTTLLCCFENFLLFGVLIDPRLLASCLLSFGGLTFFKA